MASNESFGSLRWRGIGPHRGGRSVAVAGHPTERMTFYFGATGGGVWKTTNGGVTWENISDGFLKTASVGAIAVAESDPNVIYVGMGESAIRGNVSYGDGVYKSTDGGKSWRYVGLRDTRHIARVRVHPQNPDIVYVAALGHAFGPNSERGVFRSHDGGRTWDKVLYRDAQSGAIDLVFDPKNPRVLYAALWQAVRTPHSLSSGGPGSGVFKSTDGGQSWAEITRSKGLPEGVIGKIGLAVAYGRTERVYACVEAEDGGVFRSEDGGDTWQQVSRDRSLRSRAWYYSNIYTDPADDDTLYALNNFFWKSTDGGKNYTPVATPHPDHHDLWIDPRNPSRMIHGADGGASVSFDAGASWSTIYNQPTGEFYHIAADTRFPYRVYGAQQDNTTLSVPSRSDNAGISAREWYDVGGAESGYIAVRPDDPNIIFAGSSGGGEGGRITRYDHRTRQRRDVSAWPQRTAGMAAKDYTYRFQWTSPILLSPHDPNVLYSAANRIFRSHDEGASWELISPDLTRNDAERLGPSGGPITHDHTGVEVYCTVFALAESSLQKGLLWAGSDDGLIHISKDGGQSWQNVTPQALPEWALISTIEPSTHDVATAYVAATRYKLDDPRPYLLKTTDYGATWTPIARGIEDGDYTRVIREDPLCKGLLYCGTETGVYVSYDDGQNWQRLNLNLPTVPIHDIVVKGDELAAATHGRGFWVLSGLTVLRALQKAPLNPDKVRLFAPATTVRARQDGIFLVPKEQVIVEPISVIELPAGHSYYLKDRPKGGEAPFFLDAGQNPPAGVVIHYYLGHVPEGDLCLTIRDSAGKVVRSFSSCSEEGDQTAPKLPKEQGANRFIWDMRHEDAVKLRRKGLERRPLAALAVPGTYTVELEADGDTMRETFTIEKDPRVSATPADFEAQLTLLLEIRDKLSEIHEALHRIDSVRADVQWWMKRAEGHAQHAQLQGQADDLLAKLLSAEENLIQVRLESPQDEVNFAPKLNAQIEHLFRVVASADFAPTQQARQAFSEASAQADENLSRLAATIAGEGKAFAEAVRALELPPLS